VEKRFGIASAGKIQSDTSSAAPTKTAERLMLFTTDSNPNNKIMEGQNAARVLMSRRGEMIQDSNQAKPAKIEKKSPRVT
jgi:hypothetical protein